MASNVRDKRSFRSVAEKIWENCEPNNFPFIPCYVSRTKRSVVRAQRGATNGSKFRINFFYQYLDFQILFHLKVLCLQGLNSIQLHQDFP